MSEFQYNDILNMPYPNPDIEKDFPDEILRAAQFAPFAALTGFDEEVEETARLTDNKVELDEYQKAELNDKLMFLNNSEDDEEVSITYFVPDKKKSGGAYVTKKGIVLKIREYEKDVIMDDGTEILIDDIFAIEGNQFNEMESIWGSLNMNRTDEEKLNEIIELMKERGYDPVAQLTGYVEIGSDDYITRHGGAREKIKEVPESVIKEYLESSK